MATPFSSSRPSVQIRGSSSQEVHLMTVRIGISKISAIVVGSGKKTLDEGTNAEFRVSIALDKFSRGLQRHVGRVNRNKLSAAVRLHPFGISRRWRLIRGCRKSTSSATETLPRYRVFSTIQKPRSPRSPSNPANILAVIQEEDDICQIASVSIVILTGRRAKPM